MNWVFVDMDDQDRIRIEVHLKEIDYNQKSLIKQVKFNTEMQ